MPSVASKLVTGGEHAGDETALRQTVSAMFASGSAAVSPPDSYRASLLIRTTDGLRVDDVHTGDGSTFFLFLIFTNADFSQ